MIKVRKSDERGHFQNHWLDSRHTFSFGEYHDPEYTGVSVLRVINDDRVAPENGFPAHSHNNMEIVSYVLEGALAHKDSLGNGSVIHPGEVQLMSAGTGVAHSEFNPSTQDGARFLQIWLLPNQRGVLPGYVQKLFSAEEKQGRLRLLVSPDGRDGSLHAHSDALLYGVLLEEGQRVEHALAADRMAYVHVARGALNLNGARLEAGDGATISAEAALVLSDGQGAEVLLFDLPAA